MDISGNVYVYGGIAGFMLFLIAVLTGFLFGISGVLIYAGFIVFTIFGIAFAGIIKNERW